MGIENLRHIQKRLETEKKKTERKKQKSVLGIYLAAGIVGQAAAFGVGTLMDTHQKQDSYQGDTPAILLKLAAEKNKLPVEQFTSMEKELPDRLVFNVALLAHNAEPRYSAFEKDPALTNADQIDRNLVLPLVMHKQTDSVFWNGLSEEFHRYGDPSADVRLDLLKHLSGKFEGLDPVELEESVAYVARNLYVKGEEPTAENVQSEVRSILESREALANEDIFDRDTMLVSADEIWSEGSAKGEPRFGNRRLSSELEERLRMSGNVTATFSHITPLFHDSTGYHSNNETVGQAKKETLEKIAHAERPLTVFFDGHGGNGYFSFSASSGKVENETINFYELAGALTERWRSEITQHPEAKELPIALVFDDCMMQTFVRQLSTELAAHNVPLPQIMITTSEWEQYGFSNESNSFGSNFNDLMVKSLNLGTVMARKHNVQDSDPSVFAPRKDQPTKLMQISGIVVASDTV